ncbi:protein of unknown function [Rhodovastum atsumiense]|nr:protein of unknown function [Rhodovastum atsumiense]
MPGEAVDRRQPHAGAGTMRLGGEERVERVFQHLGCHAAAGIGDGQGHVFARRQIRRTGGLGLQGKVGGGDAQHATARHGVAGVDGEVQHRILHLRGIGFGDPQPGGAIELDADGFAEAALQQVHRVRHHRVQVDRLARQRLLARKRQQAAHHLAAVQCRADDLPGRPRHHGVTEVRERLRRQGDDAEQVVEVVGDAAGQFADRLQAVGLAQRRLHHAPFGDVLGDGEHHRRGTARVLEPGERHAQPDLAPGAREHADVAGIGGRCLGCAGRGQRDLGAGGEQFEQRPPGKFRLAGAEHAGEGVVGLDDAVAARRQHGDAERAGGEDLPQLAFGFLQRRLDPAPVADVLGDDQEIGFLQPVMHHGDGRRHFHPPPVGAEIDAVTGIAVDFPARDAPQLQQHFLTLRRQHQVLHRAADDLVAAIAEGGGDIAVDPQHLPARGDVQDADRGFLEGGAQPGLGALAGGDVDNGAVQQPAGVGLDRGRRHQHVAQFARAGAVAGLELSALPWRRPRIPCLGLDIRQPHRAQGRLVVPQHGRSGSVAGDDAPAVRLDQVAGQWRAVEQASLLRLGVQWQWAAGTRRADHPAEYRGKAAERSPARRSLGGRHGHPPSRAGDDGKERQQLS